MAKQGSNAGDNTSVADAAHDNAKGHSKRSRTARSFPALSFKESLALADAIQKHGAGQPIRRLTLFEALNKSPDSSTSGQLITSSSQYGISTGSYRAESLALTPKGKVASDPASPGREKIAAQFELAIDSIAPFKAIFERYVGSRLPTSEVLRDAAEEADVPEEHVSECVETFLANARELGLIRTIAGSEHLVSLDAVLEGLAPKTESFPVSGAGSAVAPPTQAVPLAPPTEDLSKVCFIVSPIGDEDSEERRHADLVLGSLIEPAPDELGLVAVRPDKISKPGLITSQVIDHLVRAKLVIADLSFNNPNVFYELALRHATRKPLVQIIRKGDKLPFDVNQFRTVELDMTDIYTLVPKIDLYRQEISRQCRTASADDQGSENPLVNFYPTFWDQFSS